MTRTEALQTLQRMMTIWPNVELPDATVAWWVDWLQRQPATNSLETVDALAAECRWFPSVSEFQTAARRVHTARQQAEPPKALPAPTMERERFDAWLATVSATLRSKPLVSTIGAYLPGERRDTTQHSWSRQARKPTDEEYAEFRAHWTEPGEVNGQQDR